MSFELQKKQQHFFVMVNDRVGDGDKSSYESFGARRLRFCATSYLKIKAKQIFP